MNFFQQLFGRKRQPITPIIPTDPQTIDEQRNIYLSLLNSERIKRKLAPLQYHNDLNTLAQNHSDTMSAQNYLSHDLFFERMSTKFPNKLAAENVAYGRGLLGEIFSMWMNYPAHFGSMMNKDFTHCGLANTGLYWTGNFVKL